MQPVTLRPRFGIALTVAVWATCLVVLVTAGIDRGLADALRYSPGILLTGYACWMAYWAPAIRIDPSGVSLRNIIRTRRVTWPAIQRVDTKYALTLVTAQRKYSAWSAPAPSRFTMMNARRQEIQSLPESTYGPGYSIGLGDLPKSDSGLAAYHVRSQWEGLRDAGHLDLGVVEGSGIVTTWHRKELIALAVLVALTFVAGIV